jgi:hypothetical protein
MDTTFGLRGSIVPASALGDFAESFTDGPFQISVNNGVIEIGYEDEWQAEAARKIIRQYLDAASFARQQPLRANVNQSWRKRPEGGKDFGVSFSETVHVTDDLQATTTTVRQTGTAFLVKAFDSRSLASQREITSKARKHPALSSALQYLNEEVVGDDRPLYGIYKALEALTGALDNDGRGLARLGALAGQSKKFVSAVMETAQTTRHHADPNARTLLSESECRERARRLIAAYAQSLS